MIAILLLACKGKDATTTPDDGLTSPTGGTGDTGATTAAPSGVVWVLSGADVLAGTTTAAALAVLSAGDGDAVGVALATTDDLDGDGTGELAVGLGAGKVAIVPGSVLRVGGAVDLLAAASVVDVGGTVTAVATGDFDGDGTGDLAVGRSAWNGTAEAGTVGIWPGSALLPPSVFTFQDAVASIEDPLAEWIGQSLAAADLDGDGAADLLATARYAGGAVTTTTATTPQAARVDGYGGPTLSGGARLDPTAAAWRVLGDPTLPAAPVAAAGDPDGDLRPDLWIGNFRFASPAPGDTPWSDAAGGLAIRDARPFPTDEDLDGDGVSELVTVLSSGQLLLFSGAEVVGGVGTTEARSRIDYGATQAGIVPDLDGDGVGEVWGSREEGTDAGEVRFFSGAQALAGTLPVGEPTAEVPAPAGEIGFGRAVVALDDLDGDGVREVAVSATAGSAASRR